ncbi:hypothetical protein N8Y96_03225, partial [Saprospiraceae bacterium]|nr:hypothetical protein [Saprospiraceae bacterium]
MSIKRYNTFYIPKELDINQLVINNEPITTFNNKNLSKKRDHFILMLDKLLRARKGHQCKVRDFSNDIKFPFCTNIVKGIFREYVPYINALVDAEIIWKTEDAVTGACSKYRFLEPYNSNAVRKEYIFSTGNKNSDKVLLAASTPMKAIVQQPVVTKYARQYESYKYLKVDFERADILLKELYPDDLLRQESTRSVLNRLDDFGEVEGVEITFKNGETNRLYTHFSNLSKRFRKCLMIKGEYILEMDIGNS